MRKSLPKVVITDETLRDGLQIERQGITLDEKLRLIDMLTAAGIKRLVVGAFVNPKWSPQMAETEQLVGLLKPREGVVVRADRTRGGDLGEAVAFPAHP